MEQINNKMQNIAHSQNDELVVVKLMPDEDSVRDYIGENIDYTIEEMKSGMEYSAKLAVYLQKYPGSDLEEFAMDLEENIVQDTLTNTNNHMYVAYWNGEDTEMDEKYVEKMYESDTGYCAETKEMDFEDITPGTIVHIADFSADFWHDMDLGHITIK
jgi:predicted ribosome quality control (RQC) complex YloA/Tae2 family protein|tara:strand:- start:318 stop:791 length:474 start_codon:yes stop_codon:yes gene_type:complete